MRQVRMPMKPCAVPEYLADYFPTCTDNYQIYSEETKNYGAQWIPLDTANAQPDSGFEYFSEEKTKTSPDYYSFALYSGGGYVAELGPDKDSAYSFVKKLYQSKWVDLQTKAIFIEMLILNPQTKYFTTITTALEFLDTGGSVQSNINIYTFSLNYFEGPQGGVRFILCLVTISFIAIFAIKEGIIIYQQRKKYFKVTKLNTSNTFDILL